MKFKEMFAKWADQPQEEVNHQTSSFFLLPFSFLKPSSFFLLPSSFLKRISHHTSSFFLLPSSFPKPSSFFLLPSSFSLSPAFTLIEVNLAMLIMAGGILSAVGLYALGFRENRQGREDVAAAAYADAVISPLVLAISSTNVTWTNFRQEKYYPSADGWKTYLNSDGIVSTDPQTRGEGAFGFVKSWLGGKDSDLDYNFPSAARPSSPKMSCAVVIMHPQDSAVATIGFRAVDSKNYKTLMSMPLFFTQVRFQGASE